MLPLANATTPCPIMPLRLDKWDPCLMALCIDRAEESRDVGDCINRQMFRSLMVFDIQPQTMSFTCHENVANGVVAYGDSPGT